MQGLAFIHPIRGQRTVGRMLLAIVLFSGVVFQVPKDVVKDRSIPFPCMNCHCSCSNATSCWNTCCCMSDAGKLAWAEENGVAPPAWFLARFGKPFQQVVPREAGGDAACSRCAKCITPAASSVACSKVTLSTPATIKVLAIEDRKCKGLDSLFAMISLSLAAGFNRTWQPDTVAVAALHDPQPTVQPVFLSPPSPPPDLS